LAVAFVVAFALAFAVVRFYRSSHFPNTRHPERSEWTTVLAVAFVVAFVIAFALAVVLVSRYPKASALGLISPQRCGL
jgi:hypothetical protein